MRCWSAAPLPSIRLLRGFGLKVGPTTPRTFEARVRELVDGHPTLVMVADALLAARAELQRRFKDLEKRAGVLIMVPLGTRTRPARRARPLPVAPTTAAQAPGALAAAGVEATRGQ